MRAGHPRADVEGVPHEVVSLSNQDGSVYKILTCGRYHWSVEYFEDLRNVNHCEFIVMKQSETNKKYILQNELRTWSELKRRAAAAGGTTSTSTTPSRTHSHSALTDSPTITIPTRRWGGCVNGCNHDKINWPKRPMRKNTVEYMSPQSQSQSQLTSTSILPGPAMSLREDDESTAPQDGNSNSTTTTAPTLEEPTPSKLAGRKHSAKVALATSLLPPTPASPNDASADASTSDSDDDSSAPPPLRSSSTTTTTTTTVPRTSAILRHLHPASSLSQHTPADGFSDDSDYFPGMQQHMVAAANSNSNSNGTKTSRLRASSRQRQASKERKLARKQTEREQSWKEESGMGTGRRADALGDGDDDGDEAGTTSAVDDAGAVAVAVAAEEGGSQPRTTSADVTTESEQGNGEPILREALKGSMQVERGAEEGATQGEERIGQKEIERLEEKEGSVREQVY